MINLLRRRVPALLLATLPSLCCAQAFPSKPIKIVVGFGAGGLSDVLARKLAEGMTRDFGQPVIVENKVGGNSIIATQSVASAAPDGYTLHLGNLQTSFVTHPAMYRKLPYDAEKDYTPVALIAEIPLGLMVRADTKFNSAKDFIAHARMNPDRITFGSAGVSMIATLGAHVMNDKAGIKLTQVPYQGTAPALQALLAGQVDSVFADLSSAAALIRAGSVKVLATATNKRVSQFPHVPTFAEEGIKDAKVPAIWSGIVGPAGMPMDIVKRLNAQINKLVAEPGMKALLDQFVLTPMPGGPEVMAKQIAEDNAVWPPVIKKLGITLE